MYVCICNAVTEREVRDRARAGLRSVEELTAELGVGAGCGRCLGCAAEVLGEVLGEVRGGEGAGTSRQPHLPAASEVSP
jgi:bacterioferritin-associated ferredoxin